jgi:hypothetical protein
LGIRQVAGVRFAVHAVGLQLRWLSKQALKVIRALRHAHIIVCAKVLSLALKKSSLRDDYFERHGRTSADYESFEEGLEKREQEELVCRGGGSEQGQTRDHE